MSEANPIALRAIALGDACVWGGGGGGLTACNLGSSGEHRHVSACCTALSLQREAAATSQPSPCSTNRRHGRTMKAKGQWEAGLSSLPGRRCRGMDRLEEQASAGGARERD